MKLADLMPKDVTNGDSGRVVGVSFACPAHYSEGLGVYGEAKCSWSRMTAFFANPPDGLAPDEGLVAAGFFLWLRGGKGLEDLSLTPSYHAQDHSERNVVTHWHGFIKNGEVTTV